LASALALAPAFAPLPAHALPAYQDVRAAHRKSDSVLLDRRGEILNELRVDRSRRRLDWTALPEVSPALREAVVHAEDKRFFRHGGVDYGAAAAALLQGLIGQGRRGASTISMQTAALIEKDLRAAAGRRSLTQKWRQMAAARELEARWSKDEILEAYLNLLSFRGEFQGIAAAARGLFQKDPHGLDRAESLVLAALIPSPNAPAETVLRRALGIGASLGWPVADGEIRDKVRHVFLGAGPMHPRADLAPHVARQLLRGQPAGAAVSCTVDAEAQRFAVERLVHHLLSLATQNVGEGAVLAVENDTGHVLLYASHTTEPAHVRYVDGVRARRQAGSTLKPFLYALALDRRIVTPASRLDDGPLDVAVPGGIYQPRNYDALFRGPVTVRKALGSSLNVPAVRLLSLVGAEPFLRTLRDLGIEGLGEPADFYGPSLALGSADLSLWELVAAYRALANGGLWDGLQLAPERVGVLEARRVFSPEAAFLVTSILADREARSLTFGLENPLATRFPAAVKTGTSKDMRDNWCIGYSPRYTAGVWVGNFSGEPMWDVSGVSGAAPLWLEVMNFLHREGSPPWQAPPPGIVRRQVEQTSGPYAPTHEWFMAGTEPLVCPPPRGPASTISRIVYPPHGAVIALDPDIPPEQQRVLFVAQGDTRGHGWVLNGQALGQTGRAVPWLPVPGRHAVSLMGPRGELIDGVSFHVRGLKPRAARGEEGGSVPLVRFLDRGPGWAEAPGGVAQPAEMP
jgi:penicillin-binding protein 1C